MSVKVGVIMGSKSDWNTLEHCTKTLSTLGIEFEAKVVSAHRTPDLLFSYAETAEDRGIEVIIAGAGGAAHLPGMIASITTLPVIGVPIKSSNSIDGWDSILSILQMPNGVPVATVALNAAKNAGILAAQIIGTQNETIALAMADYKLQMETEVLGKVNQLKSNWDNQFDA
jgi:5-(carboxyamino)imidazole ribonucleotide mutase